jgi:hypothetical protein
MPPADPPAVSPLPYPRCRPRARQDARWWGGYRGNGFHAAIEGLRGESVSDGDQGHVRLLAKRKAKAKRAVSGQVADEKVRQRLAIFLRFLVLDTERGHLGIPLVIVAVFDDLAIGVDANTIPICAILGLRFRLLVLRTDETALDAGLPVMGEDNEHAAARDVVGIVGMTQAINALDLGFQFFETLIDVIGQFIGAVVLLGQGIISGLRRFACGLVLRRQRYRLRVIPAQTMCMRKVDMDRNPFPALRLNRGSDTLQLFQHKLVQKGGILIEAAAILREQVADGNAAGLGVGFRADEDRAPIRHRRG